jgi:predicted glycoside hydrolase/deacetylase ChbG (UPF0249 family)
VLPAEQVPSLVDDQGRFWSLGRFILRLYAGQIQAHEIEAELQAQATRFRDLVGRFPTVVNSHHHVQVFAPVGAILRRILASGPRPYMRRVREPWRLLAQIPGARAKRVLLSVLGRREACGQEQEGFPGNDWLAGITDPPWVADPDFLVRWLSRLPGRVGELTCHPGYHDDTLLGRDCTFHDGQLRRRRHELHLLQQERFLEVCRHAGWTLISPTAWLARRNAAQAQAA